MTEQWTTEEVRAHLDLASIRAASRALHRMGIRPVARQPGRSGMNLYDADEVRWRAEQRPRRGVRTDLKEGPSWQE